MSIATRQQKGVAKKLGMSVEEYMSRLEAGEKWCTRCKQWHPRTAFGPDRSKRDGLRGVCQSGRQRYPEWTDIRLLSAARNGQVYRDDNGNVWRVDPHTSGGRQRANAPGRRALDYGWLKFDGDGNAALTVTGLDLVSASERRRAEGVRPTARLAKADVVAIRTRRANGESIKSLSAAFGISTDSVSRIANGLAWKNVGVHEAVKP